MMQSPFSTSSRHPARDVSASPSLSMSDLRDNHASIVGNKKGNEASSGALTSRHFGRIVVHFYRFSLFVFSCYIRKFFRGLVEKIDMIALSKRKKESREMRGIFHPTCDFSFSFA